MTTPAQQLATRLNEAFGGADTLRWLWRPLLQLIATGEPVGIGQIAATTGRTEDQIGAALAAMPDTEYDPAGRVIGSGLTQQPTPHHFEVDGHPLYTWCALDTLLFPTVLGRTARITSACHTTGQPIRLTVDPDKITHVEPATAVVSIVTPDAPASIRNAFCNHVHFFANPDAATPWLDQHPDDTVLPIADAYQLGKPLTQSLLDDNTPPTCGC